MNSTTPTETHSLTNLPGESAFAEQTQHLLEFSERTKAKAAMLFITFDAQVSEINAEQNNLALNAISNRLLSKARESDIYAHLNGMDFANLSIETSEQHAPILVEKLKNELAKPIKLIDGSSIKLNSKVGSAQFPADGGSYEELINVAKQNATH